MKPVNDLATRKERLKRALCDWALVETITEVLSGFPWLMRIKTPEARFYIGFLDGFDTTTKFHVAESLASLPGYSKPWLMHREIVKIYRESFPLWSSGPGSPRREHGLALKSAIMLGFGLRFGNAQPCAGNGWKYSIPVCEHRLDIKIRYNAQTTRLQYSHDIYTRDGNKLISDISLLQWHGIYKDTVWPSVAETDIESTVELLLDLSLRFELALPEIFSQTEAMQKPHVSCASEFAASPR